MGTLVYGSDRFTIEIDDRTLAHLQLAVVAKLRRRESFALTWRDEDGSGQGRTVLWIHEAIPLRFEYAGSRMASVNKAWVDELLATASTTVGMRLTPEPGPDPAVVDAS